MVTPVTLPLMRLVTRLMWRARPRRRRGADPAVGRRRAAVPAAGGHRPGHRRCCGSTAAATSSAMPAPGRRAVPPLRPRPRCHRGVGRLPAGTRAPLPGPARGLLLGADLVERAAVGGSRPRRDRRSQRGRRPGRRTGAAGPRSRRGRVGRPAAGLSDARRPHRGSRRTSTIPGLRLWNQSSNKFGWSAYLGDADPEVAVPARRDGPRAGCRRHGWVSERWTCSTTRTSRTPSD